MPERRPAQARPIRLGWGLALSVACHVLFALLLALLAPIPRSNNLRTTVQPNDHRIQFSFVEPHDLPPIGPPPGVPNAPPRIVSKASRPQPSASTAAPPMAGPRVAAPALQPHDPGKSRLEPRSGTPEDQAPPTAEPQPPERMPDLSRSAASSHRPSLREALREFRDPQNLASPDDRASGQGGSHNVFAPDLSQIPQTGYGLGNLTFEGRDYDWDDYGRQIYMEILKAWYRRLWAETDEFERWGLGTRTLFLDHRTAVSFTIERSGQVTAIVQEASSGCPPLDRSAVDALAEVILPPLPADFPRDSETVHARFIIVGELRGMRESLQAYRGWF